MSEQPRGVRQLRLVVECDDYDTAVAFYRDVLGMPQQEAFESAGGARGVVLDAGRATLEVFNRAQRELVDDLEIGRDSGHRMRVALEVDDSAATTSRATEGGAHLVAAPTETPWRSLNSRLDAPGGLHVTLFTELGPEG